VTAGAVGGPGFFRAFLQLLRIVGVRHRIGIATGTALSPLGSYLLLDRPRPDPDPDELGLLQAAPESRSSFWLQWFESSRAVSKR
jgi:hypothetical protein